MVGHWHKSEDRQGTLHGHLTFNLLPGSTIWLTMRCFVFVFFLFFSFCLSFCFSFLFFFFLFAWGGGYLCCVYVLNVYFVLCLCCLFLIVIRSSNIYLREIQIIYHSLFSLLSVFTTKCVGNLSMIFSIQKEKFVFIWSKWRLMGIIFRHDNII